MKHIITFCFLFISVAIFAQAKKPTIMVVPSDLWCNQNGYMMTFDNQGTQVKVPDYKRALQEDKDLLLVISKINGLMLDRDFPLKNLESQLKTISSNSAEDLLISSKSSGAETAISPIDELKSVAKADIIMQLTWSVNTLGPKRSVTYNLQGLDAYTDKQIATAAGTGNPSFAAETAVLLEEAVVVNMDEFNNSLQEHFNDLFENGREVILRIRRWNDWDEDLESVLGDEDIELGEAIEDWMADNTVNSRYSTTDATENQMLFEQVRIPLFRERNGKQYAMDTRRFARNLSRYLKSEYDIISKVTTKGLGRATVYLGSK